MSSIYTNGFLALLGGGDATGGHTAQLDLMNASFKAALANGYTYDPDHMDLDEVITAGADIAAVTPSSITVGLTTGVETIDTVDFIVVRLTLSGVNFDYVPSGGGDLDCLLVYQSGDTFNGADYTSDAEKMMLLHFDDLSGFPYTPLDEGVAVFFSPSDVVVTFPVAEV